MQDLRYGWRILRKAPGFTITAVLVLALGIGVPLTAYRQMLFDLEANSAPDPDTLVQLTRRAPGMLDTVLPYPEVAFYATNAHSFRRVIAVSQPYLAWFSETPAQTSTEQVSALFTTANYFPEFGVTPALGRFFTSRDERPDSELVALVGETFWRNRLGADAGIIGRTIRVNGKPVHVIGVVPGSRSLPCRSMDTIAFVNRTSLTEVSFWATGTRPLPSKPG